jgi:hypothetical protein
MLLWHDRKPARAKRSVLLALNVADLLEHVVPTKVNGEDSMMRWMNMKK